MNNNKIGKKSLNRFRTNFYILDNLVKRLLNDPYVTNEDKIELIKILQDSLRRQIEIRKENRNRNGNKR